METGLLLLFPGNEFFQSGHGGPLFEDAVRDVKNAHDDFQPSEFALLLICGNDLIDFSIDFSPGDIGGDRLAGRLGGGSTLQAIGMPEVGGDWFGALAAIEVVEPSTLTCSRELAEAWAE